MQRWSTTVSVLCLICCVLVSCTRAPSRNIAGQGAGAGSADSMPIRRADPGYLQYLERQSMLATAAEMAKIVSGSQLAWRTSASMDSPDEFLNYADSWVEIHPLTLLTDRGRSVFSQFSDGISWAVLREAGIQGIYIAPVGGAGDIWARNLKGVRTGEDVVQHAFSEAAGKDEDYRRFMGAVIERNALAGSDLVPAATGLGPDFFLAARNLREYPGAYCMVDIPRDLWPALPQVEDEWSVEIVSPEGVAALNAEGLLPVAMSDEIAPAGRRTGWAATGEVRGLDGNTRRWVYRYYRTPRFAVLNWEDPSRAANRILSGSAVRQVGMQGQVLLGLRLQALQGLEAAPKNPSNVTPFSVEPALTAAQSLSREVRRYGGWTWVRDDNLTLPALRRFMQGGTDFITDSAFSPAAEHALLTGDATLLRFMADEVLRVGVDTRRLVHTMPAQDGVNYSLPHLRYLAATGGGERAEQLRRYTLQSMRAKASDFVHQETLYSTAAGIAALGLGLPGTSVPPQDVDAVARGHMLLIQFKAMQPGVLMLAGQDLVGALPLQWSSMVGDASAWDTPQTSRGAYALTSAGSARNVSRQGVARTQTLYPPADVQVHEKGSFVSRVGHVLRSRNSMGVARGTLVARPRSASAGVVALVTRLPGGKGFVLNVCNFSRSQVTEKLSLSGISGIQAAMGRVTLVAGAGSHGTSGSTVTVTLGPWQGRALLLGQAPAGTLESDGAGQTDDADGVPDIPDVPEVLDEPAPADDAPAPGSASGSEKEQERQDDAPKGDKGAGPTAAEV